MLPPSAAHLVRSAQGIGTALIEPGKRWQDGVAELALPRGARATPRSSRYPAELALPPRSSLVAFDAFVETWGVKYDKAVECLIKDRDALLVRRQHS